MIDQKQKRKVNYWLVFSLGVLILSGLLLLFLWKNIPPKIPWFYSLPWGESQLMSKGGLPIILGVSAIVLCLGNLVSGWTKKEDKIIEQVVIVSLTFICLMLIISMIKVLFIFI